MSPPIIVNPPLSPAASQRLEATLRYDQRARRDPNQGPAYTPGPDGVSPMFADFLQETEQRLSACTVQQRPHVASMVMIACDDAEQRGALTGEAASRLRAKFHAMGGRSTPVDAGAERAAIVRWLRTSRDQTALAIAGKIERGEHLA